MTYYLKKHWKLCSLTCLCLIARFGLSALMQLVAAQAFTSAMGFDLHGFLWWTALNFALWGCVSGASCLGNYLQARSVRDMNDSLRHDLYLSLLDKDHGGFHRQDSGEYLTWLTSNIKQIERLAWGPFFDCVGRASHIIWCVLALTSLNWMLLAAGLLSTALMLLVPRLFAGKMERMGAACAAAEAEGSARLKDLLGGFDVLRTFGRAERFLRQGDECSSQIEEPNFRRTYTQFNLSRVIALAATLMQIMQEVLAVVLAIQGKVIIGALVSASNLTAGITSGLSSVAEDRMSMASSRPYFEHITVHAGQDAPLDCPAPAEGACVREAITLEGVSFSYGDKPVLRDVAMEFRKGGKYALTGPSGCGKSTLLKLILGWLPDYEGSVLLDGQEVRSFTPEQLQGQMSCIEQDVFLFNSTIRDNITLGGDFTDAQMERALEGSALIGDLRSMPQGLDTPVGEEGSSLSGGQKQRVAIARALIHGRSILLVDEGTSALDQKNADIVEESLLRDPELTLILVSHHLSPERKARFTRVYELEPELSAPNK